MTVAAFSGYIAGLIERHKLTASLVMDAAGVRGNYLYKLRVGAVKEPGAMTVAGLTNAARGNLGTAMHLIIDPDANEEDGKKAAMVDEVHTELPKMTQVPRDKRTQAAAALRVIADMIERGIIQPDTILTDDEISRLTSGS